MTNLTYWNTYIDQFPDDTTIAHIPIGDLRRLVAQLNRQHAGLTSLTQTLHTVIDDYMNLRRAINAHQAAATSTVPVGGHPRHDTALWETIKDTTE